MNASTEFFGRRIRLTDCHFAESGNRGWARPGYSIVGADADGEIFVERASTWIPRKHRLYVSMQAMIRVPEETPTIAQKRWERVERGTRSVLLAIVRKCARSRTIPIECTRTAPRSTAGCSTFPPAEMYVTFDLPEWVRMREDLAGAEALLRIFAAQLGWKLSSSVRGYWPARSVSGTSGRHVSEGV